MTARFHVQRSGMTCAATLRPYTTAAATCQECWNTLLRSRSATPLCVHQDDGGVAAFRIDLPPSGHASRLAIAQIPCDAESSLRWYAARSIWSCHETRKMLLQTGAHAADAHDGEWSRMRPDIQPVVQLRCRRTGVTGDATCTESELGFDRFSGCRLCRWV